MDKKYEIDKIIGENIKPKCDTLALYSLYKFMSEKQCNDCFKCSTKEASKIIGISETRVRAARKNLIGVGLIEDVIVYGGNGRISAHYIKFKE